MISTPQAGTLRTITKAAFHPTYTQNTAPQTPPKKGSVVGRGVPPPIPPNKPIIPNKQTPIRRSEGVEADKKKMNTPGTKEIVNPSTSTEPGRSAPPGIEMLGQELADFQQMFVTMATSNNT